MIGQADLYSDSPNGIIPLNIAADNSGGVYVVENNKHRVLYFPPGATTPSRVYGQPDMTSTAPNRGANKASADSLFNPSSIAIASDGVYISDSSNNRVLFYSGTSTMASRVYGQGGSFTSSKSGVSADELNRAWGVFVDNENNLYVADSNNHRVLFYPAGSTTATRVYGQGGSFNTKDAPSPPTADSLSYPSDVSVSNTGVYIADYWNNRVLFYSGASTTASMVYGQSGSFVTRSVPSSPTAHSMRTPNSVTLDNQCNLYVSDPDNNRVLFFPAGSTVTTPTLVYGQGDDFTTNTPNKGGIGPASLYYPRDVAVGGNALFIADRNNNRVLKYPLNDGTAAISANGPCSRNTLPSTASTIANAV